MPTPATSRLIPKECKGIKHVNAFSQNVNRQFLDIKIMMLNYLMITILFIIFDQSFLSFIQSYRFADPFTICMLKWNLYQCLQIKQAGKPLSYASGNDDPPIDSLTGVKCRATSVAKNKYIQRTPSKSDPRDLWPLRHLIRVMRRHDLTKKRRQ